MRKLSEEDIERIVAKTVAKVLEEISPPAAEPAQFIYQPHIEPHPYNPYNPYRVTC